MDIWIPGNLGDPSISDFYRSHLKQSTALCAQSRLSIENLFGACQASIAKDTTVDANLAFTTGCVDEYALQPLHDIVRMHCRSILLSKREILITSSYWEKKSKAAHLLCSAIEDVLRREKDVKVKIVVDNGNLKNIIAPYFTRTFSKEEIFRRIGEFPTDLMDRIEVKSLHVPLVGTMHAKFLVVDRSSGILSSNNVQDRPNLELGVSLNGNIVKALVDVFSRMWKSDMEDIPTSSLCSDGTEMEMLMLNRRCYGRLTKNIFSPQNCGWLHLMETAQNEIIICTPTFNAEEAVDVVQEACKRGVGVKMILTKNFNDKKEVLPFQGGTNNHVVKKMKRCLKRKNRLKNLEVRWYVGRNEKRPRRGVHSHVKFLLVDSEWVMFGNGNMDTQSWNHSMEVNIALKNREMYEYLKRTMMLYSKSDGS